MGEHKFVGIFGMMGSGKSTLINEYLIERPESRVIEFTPPPVEAKFRGMDFEFVDQIFALQENGITFNFYELDAPTINKWTQFIHIADAIVIAYNYLKDDYFESPKQFITNIRTFSRPEIPLFFVVNACPTLEQARDKLEDVFTISQFGDRSMKIINIPSGEIEFTQSFGRRVRIDISILDTLYSSVIEKLQ
ncbi:MAG: hypothetical protein ACXAE3_08325 [Candidatus Kariarchaeaceae archaeon]|jgi:GTPase SAR1 family protein